MFKNNKKVDMFNFVICNKNSGILKIPRILISILIIHSQRHYIFMNLSLI